MDGDCCGWYPEVCVACEQENSSFHILFQCVHFSRLRNDIFLSVGISTFCFDTLASAERPVQDAIVLFGRKRYLEIRNANPADLSPVDDEEDEFDVL